MVSINATALCIVALFLAITRNLGDTSARPTEIGDCSVTLEQASSILDVLKSHEKCVILEYIPPSQISQPAPNQSANLCQQAIQKINITAAKLSNLYILLQNLSSSSISDEITENKYKLFSKEVRETSEEFQLDPIMFQSNEEVKTVFGELLQEKQTLNLKVAHALLDLETDIHIFPKGVLANATKQFGNKGAQIVACVERTWPTLIGQCLLALVSAWESRNYLDNPLALFLYTEADQLMSHEQTDSLKTKLRQILFNSVVNKTGEQMKSGNYSQILQLSRKQPGVFLPFISAVIQKAYAPDDRTERNILNVPISLGHMECARVYSELYKLIEKSKRKFSSVLQLAYRVHLLVKADPAKARTSNTANLWAKFSKVVQALVSGGSAGFICLRNVAMGPRSFLFAQGKWDNTRGSMKVAGGKHSTVYVGWQFIPMHMAEGATFRIKSSRPNNYDYLFADDQVYDHKTMKRGIFARRKSLSTALSPSFLWEIHGYDLTRNQFMVYNHFHHEYLIADNSDNDSAYTTKAAGMSKVWELTACTDSGQRWVG